MEFSMTGQENVTL